MIDLAGRSRPTADDSPSPELEALLQEHAEDWMAGTPRPLQVYLDRHPIPGDRRSLLLELIHQEVMIRKMQGQSPRPDEYLADHPDLSESLRRMFEVHLAETGPGPSLPSSTPDPSDLPPTFGRYRIVERLGRGGMGTVYLAHDPELDRRVALKVPRDDYERSPEAILRFQHEARAAAAVDHPNVCRIYEVGEIDGRHYIAMAFIDGRPLSAFIDPASPMNPESGAAWALRLALILAEAHTQKIIHRDLKPSNVMVDRRGELIVTDFGLARRLGDGGPDLTRSGLLVGSPHYMAPEQVEGIKELIGPACDIYSLGVILYELLTGQRPFRGSTPRILAQILTQEPASPSSLRPGIDRELEQICQTAMARSIADRYPSMTSMAEALAAWLARHRLAVAGNGGLETTPAEPKCDLPKWPDAPSQGAPRTGKATQRKWTAASPGHDRWKAVLLAFAIGVLASELRRIFVGPPGPGSDRSQRPSAAIVGSEPVIRPAPGVAFVRGKNSVGMDLVRIEPGEYPMGSLDIEGSDEERPQHRVVITRPFLLGVCEVTVPQYRAVVDDDPTWLRDPEPIPMTNVDWFDAVRFCNRLSVREGLPPYYRISGQGGEPDVAIIRLDGPGYRLATEAEWEYACRAGSAHRHPAGRDDATLARYAWYNANSGKQVHPVSQKLPNAWGFCDMLGNAWEWCQDGYAPTYYQLSPTTDPPGPPEATRRVMRGGSIFDDYFCRSAARQGHPPGTRMAWLGFRVAAFTR